jgi:dolichol-phosphate mannosyltransferase
MSRIDLSVVVPVLNERENVERLLPRTARVLDAIGCAYELVVVDGGSHDGTPAAADAAGATVIRQTLPGYGGALREGLERARGDYILTLDADLSHDPDFIAKLWRGRLRADVVIASRYVKGGVAYMPRHRLILSRILNAFFARGLDLPIRDLSSGFRLYRAAAVRRLDLEGTNFEVLEEILVKAHVAGWRIGEIPFTYYPRERGSSHARIVHFGIALLRAFVRLRRLRTSTAAADHDERAFYGMSPVVRWRARRRHRIVCGWTRGEGKTLEVGCGSSLDLQSINDVVGLDLRHDRLRYMRRYDVPLVRAAARALPIRDGAFDCVVCLRASERSGDDAGVLAELGRVLKPRGLLLLGASGADGQLAERSHAAGFRLEDTGRISRREVVLALRKETPSGGAAG